MSDFECPECGESFDRRRTMHSHAAQLHGDEFTDEMPWRDENTLIELYHGEQMNTQEIADELGCAATTIRKWMDRNNIEARSMSEVWQIIEHPHKSGRHNTPEELLDGEWLREQYHDLEKNAAEIAEMLECTEGTVRRWRDKHGIERRSMDDILRAKYTPDVLLDKEWLREEYVNKERTAMDIADDLECTFITVSRWVIGLHPAQIILSTKRTKTTRPTVRIGGAPRLRSVSETTNSASAAVWGMKNTKSSLDVV